MNNIKDIEQLMADGISIVKNRNKNKNNIINENNQIKREGNNYCNQTVLEYLNSHIKRR